MKRIKLFLLAAIMLVAANAISQKVVMANYPDTLSGSQTKYYPAAVFADLVYGSFQVYVDHITGSSDSTYISIQGSVDGSTWVTLGSSSYSSTVTSSDPSPTAFAIARFSTTDAGMIWNIANPLTLPYYRFAVTHYATGTVRVKGWLYKKK